MKKTRVLILNNIRSVINVGAIFRTADAIGIDKVFLTGYTPTPVDRFGKERKDFAKASLGAEVDWEFRENPRELISELKEQMFQIVSLEQSSESVDYKEVQVGNLVAVVLGNEVEGVDKDILDISDIIAEIPMVGSKESLNVSVAAGVFLFRLFDGNHKSERSDHQ
jgi:23S rRNA (guanosine2251-2'-O)-methyltransferase